MMLLQAKHVRSAIVKNVKIILFLALLCNNSDILNIQDRFENMTFAL